MSAACDPHGGEHAEAAGAPLGRARLALVMLHGRGGTPSDMLALAQHLAMPDVACIAPRAAGGSWWPDSFLAPLAANEPGLASALGAVAAAVEGVERAGFGPERVVLTGFSQGACLTLEYAARAGRPFRGVAGLSGGLIGTAEAGAPAQDVLYGHFPKRFDYGGRLDGVPVFLGCHERDPHIPLARVRESAWVFERLGARVTTQIHPGAGHAVVEEEIRHLRGLLNA